MEGLVVSRTFAAVVVQVSASGLFLKSSLEIRQSVDGGGGVGDDDANCQMHLPHVCSCAKSTCRD